MTRSDARRIVCCLTLILVASAHSAEAKKYTIDTSPVKGGRVSVNGTFVGIAPVTVELKLKKTQTAVATAEKDGAISLWSSQFSREQKGTVQVRLEEDKAYKETFISDVANTWLTLTPSLTRTADGEIDEGKVWQKIVSIVTDEFSDLEQMDRSSFYLRTTWRLRRFPYTVLRHRLVVKRGVNEELSVRIQLESQIYRGTGANPSSDLFIPVARIFQRDKETIDFLRDQL